MLATMGILFSTEPRYFKCTTSYLQAPKGLTSWLWLSCITIELIPVGSLLMNNNHLFIVLDKRDI